MHNLKYSLLIVILAITLVGCNKNSSGTSYCDNLAKGLIAEDVTMVSNVLKDELTFYSKENLNELLRIR